MSNSDEKTNKILATILIVAVIAAGTWIWTVKSDRKERARLRAEQESKQMTKDFIRRATGER